MKKICLIALGVIIGAVVLYGCSEDDRVEVSDRLSAAGKALTGEVRADGERTAKIVREQQRKERIRQDSTWTPENRAAHPVEYCQAQLEELAKYSVELEARVHEVACNQAAVKRQIGDKEALIANLEKFVADTKAKYIACEKANSWPAMVGGFSLSKEKTKDKIIDAAQKLPTLKAQLGTQKNQLVQLGKKADFLAKEQKAVVDLREKVQGTINDLRIKKVVEGEKSLTDALNAINDNMSSLGVDYDDPKIEDLIVPDPKTTRDELFEKIMAE